MSQQIRQKDTGAWIVQVWSFFIIAMVAMGSSILYLPTDKPITGWMKGQLSISFMFAVSASFTLAKTIRDNYEASRLTARVDEAKLEQLLATHDPLKMG